MNTNGDATFPTADSTAGGRRIPLDQVKAGKRVRIKELAATEEMTGRLRELGFCEGQIIRLITCGSHIICQVCNARMALTAKLAQMVLVEALPGY